jgi:hypothetical protein
MVKAAEVIRASSKMQRRRSLSQWTALAFLCAGCGSGVNLCDRFTQVNLSLLDKAKACNNVSFTLMSKATCEQSIKSCNSNDQTLLSSYLDCLDRSVGACVAGQENIFFGSIALCDGLLAGMSNTCKTAGFGPR